MKKTLIALAAVAVSTGAMAQATISGVFDVRGISDSKTTTQANRTARSETNKSSAIGNNNGWSTSELRFAGSEDLGGGLTASFQLNTGLNNGASTVADRDRFLNLSGGFGSVRLGAFVPAAAAGFHGFTGARTTGQAGNIYGLSQAAPTTNAILHNNTANFERQNAIQYTSPNMSGFTVAVAYGNTSSDRSETDRQGKTQGSQTSLHIAYASGPLSVGVGMNNRTDKIEAAPLSDSTTLSAGGDPVRTAAVGRAETKSSLNWIGASYDLGVARVMATRVERDGKSTMPGGAKTSDVTVNALGVAVPMGDIAFGASMFRGTDKRTTANTDDYKLSGHQLSVTYALSKRTLLYVVNGTTQNKRDSAANNGATVKTTGTSVGLSHSF